MAKSIGNVVTPEPYLVEHGSDAVRYWACAGRPGTDTAFDVSQFKVGRRLAIKLLNASKFTLTFGEPTAGAVPTEAVDLALLATMRDLVAEATKAFDGFDYARCLERTETFFWSFCDDHMELVKARAYGEASDPATSSALATLRIALSVLQRLLAPIIPFVTEEVWSWWQEGSIHRAPWPTVNELPGGGDPLVGEVAAATLSAIRRAKSDNKRNMRWPVERVEVSDTPARIAALRLAAVDIVGAGGLVDAAALVLIEATDPSAETTYTVALAPEQPIS